MDDRFLGISAALGSAAAWALGSILFKRLSETFSPLAMTFIKGTMSTILLGLVCLALRYPIPGGMQMWMLVLSGILGIALGDTFFFAALRDLSPHVLVVFFMLGQLFTAALAIVFLGEIPSLVTWMGILATLAGVALVLWGQMSKDEERRKSGMRGIVFGALSMICFSVSLIVAKPALEAIPTLMATLIRMAAGTAGVFVVGLFMRQTGHWVRPLASSGMLPRFVLSVAVVTFGGFWLSLVAIKYIEVVVANTLGATEPLFVLPLAIWVLKVKVSRMEMAGTLCAVSGMIIILTC